MNATATTVDIKDFTTTNEKGAEVTDWTAYKDAVIAAINVDEIKTQVLPATHLVVPARISLGKVSKVKSFHDEGLYQYKAEIKIDGKRVGDAVDEGNGGGIWFRQDSREAQVAYEAVENEFHALQRAKDAKAWLSPESLLNDLIEEWETAKTLNRKLKGGKRTPVLKGIESLRVTVDGGGFSYETTQWLEVTTGAGTVALHAARHRAAGITHVWSGSEWAEL